jgi:hypothetical protein
MAPDPHDDGDFEGPDTRSLLNEFMVKMAQSVNDDYKNLHALLATLPDPSVDTGPVAIYNVYINIFLFHSRESQQRPDRREQGLCLAFAWNDASHFKVCNSFPDR